jgi:hypothetical protein
MRQCFVCAMVRITCSVVYLQLGNSVSEYQKNMDAARRLILMPRSRFVAQIGYVSQAQLVFHACEKMRISSLACFYMLILNFVINPCN